MKDPIICFDARQQPMSFWGNSIIRLEQRPDILVEHYPDVDRWLIWYSDYPENASYPLAAHQQVEFMYCVDESIEYYIGSERYLFEKGDLMLLDTFVPHCLLVPEGRSIQYRRYALMINYEYFRLLLEDHPDPRASGFFKNPVVHLQEPVFRQIIALFEEIFLERSSNRIHNRLYAESLALQILCLTIRAALSKDAQPVAKEQDELADRIVAYIEGHYAEHITLSSTARALFVSESTVSHTIKKKLGVSFYAYVTQRRMLAARTLISHGTPAGEASARVGFSDYTSFLRLFKKAYGITPRQIKPTGNSCRP